VAGPGKKREFDKRPEHASEKAGFPIVQGRGNTGAGPPTVGGNRLTRLGFEMSEGFYASRLAPGVRGGQRHVLQRKRAAKRPKQRGSPTCAFGSGMIQTRVTPARGRGRGRRLGVAERLGSTAESGGNLRGGQGKGPSRSKKKERDVWVRGDLERLGQKN